MSPFSEGLPAFLQNAGMLLGFFMSLAIGSYLIRDNFLARLAQYVLVGVSLSYMAVLAWRNVLWPQLFSPLIHEPLALFVSGFSLWDAVLWQNWLPLLLGLLLWGAGFELLRRPSARPARGATFLRFLALIPAAILGGVLLGVGVAGALQGTLWPQFIKAAALTAPQITPLQPGRMPVWGGTIWLARLFVLLISGGVLIHVASLRGRTGRRSTGPPAQARGPAPEWRSAPPRIRKLLGAWEGIGRRALWLAAGVLFARLAAARFSLVLARLDYFLFEFPRSEFWQVLWAALQEGG